MPIRRDADKWLRKKARPGVLRFPAGSVAFYGPDDRRATKVAAAVIPHEGGEAKTLQRWIVTEGDARRDSAVLNEVTAFFKAHGVRSVGMLDRIIGCPHEEGIDYPKGEPCPACPFWAARDRWTGLPER
jgi:tagatose-1,6-bisphosphate aldolase non-catalytic subunit AgaZ/GatZ